MPAGTTSFKPGPIVGELQHAGFPAAIEKGKGDPQEGHPDRQGRRNDLPRGRGPLDPARDLPLEVGITLRAVVDGSTFYPPEVLSVDLAERRADVARAAAHAIGLAVEIGYPTPQSLPRLVSRAHRRALGLALATGYVTKETIEPLFAKAMREAAAVGQLMGH